MCMTYKMVCVAIVTVLHIQVQFYAYLINHHRKETPFYMAWLLQKDNLEKSSSFAQSYQRKVTLRRREDQTRTFSICFECALSSLHWTPVGQIARPSVPTSNLTHFHTRSFEIYFIYAMIYHFFYLLSPNSQGIYLRM